MVVAVFGDGLAHFHVWHIPRPLGALELRGSKLFAGLDGRPPAPPEDVDAAVEHLRRSLA